MALKSLLSGIHNEALAEVQDILNTAKNEARQQKKLTRQEAEKEAAVLYATLLSNCQNEATQQISQARLLAQKEVLRARQKLIEQLQKEVLRHLQQLPIDRYRQWMLHKVLEACETGDETLIVSEKDRSKLDADWLTMLNAELCKRHKRATVKLQYQSDRSDDLLVMHQHYEVLISFADLIKTVVAQHQKQIIVSLLEEEKQLIA